MKRIIILIIILSMLLSSSFFSAVYAGGGTSSGTVVDVFDQSDGTYVSFNIAATPATTGIRFKTIGFHISIGSATIIYKYESTSIDEAFTFKLSSIISEFARQYADYGGTASPQYKSAYDQIFKTGGTVTFNAIMTVTYSGVRQGGINDGAKFPDPYSSKFWGRVYTGLDGIQNAEDWIYETKYIDFPKYFGISYTFPKQNDPPQIPVQVIVSYWGINANGSNAIRLLPDNTINDEVSGNNSKTIIVPRDMLPPDYSDYIYESYGTNTINNGAFNGAFTNSPATVNVSADSPTIYLRFKYIKSTQPPAIGGGSGGDIIFNPNSTTWTNSGKKREGQGAFPVNVSATSTSKTFTGNGKRTTIVHQPPIPGGTDSDGTPLPDISQPDLVEVSYENFPVTYTLNSISVSGFANANFSGLGGSINLTGEGTGSLNGTGSWKNAQYSPPSGLTDLQIPPPPPNPVGSSGTYQLDWTTPALTFNSQASTGGNWSKNPYNISFTINEKLSGFTGTGYTLNDSSWYNRSSSGTASYGSYNYSKNIILQDGIYNLTIKYGDIAGNKASSNFGTYLVDTKAPDTAQFLFDTTFDTSQVSTVPSKCIYRNNRYEYMCDINNLVKVRIGDNLSGIVETKYQWSQSPNFPPTSSMNDIGGATTAEKTKDSKDLVIYFNGSTNYQNLKKGLWYLHIYQRDRAGNETCTTSPQIFINKLETLRVSMVYDPRWKHYFEKETNLSQNPPTLLQINGIKVPDMPIQKSKEQYGIKLGYTLKFKIDSVGFNNPGDMIDITAHFFAMDKKGYIFPADIYIPDKNSNYRLIQNSGYNTDCKQLVLTSTNRTISEAHPGVPEYNTWSFQYYLPYSAKVVRQGASLDLYNPNYFDNKLLVVFDIKGIKHEGDFCDYTAKETDWAVRTGSVYGYNYPSKNSLIGKGVNHGEVFWYNLYETANEDIKSGREW